MDEFEINDIIRHIDMERTKKKTATYVNAPVIKCVTSFEIEPKEESVMIETGIETKVQSPIVFGNEMEDLWTSHSYTLEERQYLEMLLLQQQPSVSQQDPPPTQNSQSSSASPTFNPVLLEVVGIGTEFYNSSKSLYNGIQKSVSLLTQHGRGEQVKSWTVYALDWLDEKITEQLQLQQQQNQS